MPERSWSAYYDAVANQPPRPTLRFALERFEEEGGAGFAVDLGCGEGRDAVELLRRGWRVLAIDAEREALERLLGRPELGVDALDRLRTEVARFEDATWPEADLLNAGFSLPFCPPAAFDDVWRRIVGSLRPGGRFAGQLFGDRDEWAGEPEMTFHARADVDRLLDGLAIEHFEELELDGSTATGTPKHWHVFHVVARRER